MSRDSLRKLAQEQNTVKKETVREHLTSEQHFEDFMDQLKGATLRKDDDGDLVIPARDVRRALDNPGDLV